MRLAVIDYGMGNLRSVEKALLHVGADGAFVTSDPLEIARADMAVLPGDGAFDTTMARLDQSGIGESVRRIIAAGRPFLGICIGMQVLMTCSEEGQPDVRGLDVVPGRILRFPNVSADGERLPVPQIGWNRLRTKPGGTLLRGVGDAAEAWVYCLHSYYCAPGEPSCVAGTLTYGVEYAAAMERGNVFATQFHPEKSGDVGLHILRNFVALR